MKKVRIMLLCALVAMGMLLSSCSGTLGLGRVIIGTEMNNRVSTVTLGDDSFTLPCSVEKFKEKEYSILICEREKYIDEDTFEDAFGYPAQVLEKSRNKCILKMDRDDYFLIFVVNTGKTAISISDSMVYAVEIRKEDFTDDWSYMGLTRYSTPEEVETAFSGILKFEIWESENSYRLIHEDLERLISFYWNKDGETLTMTQFILQTYPDGKYRDLTLAMSYPIPGAD